MTVTIVIVEMTDHDTDAEVIAGEPTEALLEHLEELEGEGITRIQVRVGNVNGGDSALVWQRTFPQA